MSTEAKQPTTAAIDGKPDVTKDEIFDAAEAMVDKFPEVHPEIVRNIFVNGADWILSKMLDMQRRNDP